MSSGCLGKSRGAGGGKGYAWRLDDGKSDAEVRTRHTAASRLVPTKPKPDGVPVQSREKSEAGNGQTSRLQRFRAQTFQALHRRPNQCPGKCPLYSEATPAGESLTTGYRPKSHGTALHRPDEMQGRGEASAANALTRRSSPSYSARPVVDDGVGVGRRELWESWGETFALRKHRNTR